MLTRGLEVRECNKIECITYGANLNFVLDLFDKYRSLEEVSIYSNDEQVSLGTARNRDRVQELYEKRKLKVYHMSIDERTIHAKVYRFSKDSTVQFMAIGSPNLTSSSNSSYESLLYVDDLELCNKIWEEIESLRLSHVEPQLEGQPIGEGQPAGLIDSAPSCLYTLAPIEFPIDKKYFDGLWKHQQDILSWLATRSTSIINIPPGTGKTKIATRYLKYLFEARKNFTAIIIVPTTTLVNQWMDRLTADGFSAQEWGTSLDGLGTYLASPEGKIIVTLYSRFVDQYRNYSERIGIISPNLIVILDECHNTYELLGELRDFRVLAASNVEKVYFMGLSATIDSFKTAKVNEFIDLMGGRESHRKISLERFYSYWNEINPNPILKQIRYIPLKYSLTDAEMEQLRRYTRHVIIERARETLSEATDYTAAIRRAQWLRGLEGGIGVLRDYISAHIDTLAEKSTIFFVQTGEMAEDLQGFVTSQQGWDPNASVYVYDSHHDLDYRKYSLEQFKKHIGFCLISERMLSEGFDLPKVDMVFLHGSHRSPRDWIQKIGRAIRYNPNEPDSVAEIIDVVFCDSTGQPLGLEEERYNILRSISR